MIERPLARLVALGPGDAERHWEEDLEQQRCGERRNAICS